MTNLEKAREVNLGLLKKVDEVCKEYGITYFADSGTLLGAVRHQGFIPWDDDVDVCFLREDFDKICSLPSEVWGDNFFLEMPPKNTFVDFIPHLVSLSTEFNKKNKDSEIKKMQGMYGQQHLACDFLVLDRAYKTRWMNQVKRCLMVMLYGMAMGHRNEIDFREYSFVQGLAIQCMGFIGKFFSCEKIIELYDRVSQHGSDSSRYLYSSNRTFSYMGLLLEKIDYGQGKKIPFESMSIVVPDNSEHILEILYGNWRVLPSDENRKCDHLTDPNGEYERT